MPGWQDFPLAAALARAFGLPVVVENDGIAAANGEWKFGSARGLDHFVYVTVSTGIGGGVVVDGRLLHGRRGLAGHVGHMLIAPDGPLCSCGARGCFEALASGSALARAGREVAIAEPGSALAGNYPAGTLTARDVVGPKVRNRGRVVARAQVAHQPAVRRKAHEAQRRPLQVRRVVQALDRQFARVGLGEAQGRRQHHHE